VGGVGVSAERLARVDGDVVLLLVRLAAERLEEHVEKAFARGLEGRGVVNRGSAEDGTARVEVDGAARHIHEVALAVLGDDGGEGLEGGGEGREESGVESGGIVNDRGLENQGEGGGAGEGNVMVGVGNALGEGCYYGRNEGKEGREDGGRRRRGGKRGRGREGGEKEDGNRVRREVGGAMGVRSVEELVEGKLGEGSG